jgi:hypothetical protein
MELFDVKLTNSRKQIERKFVSLVVHLFIWYVLTKLNQQ